MVHETKWRDFLTKLIDFRKRLKKTKALSSRAEIHSSHFVNKRPVNLAREVRLEILKAALEELKGIDYIRVMNVIVNKTNKTTDYNVFDSAWGTLFQRFEMTLENGNFPGGHKSDSGIVITDDTAGKNLQRLMRKMAVHNPIPNAGKHHVVL